MPDDLKRRSYGYIARLRSEPGGRKPDSRQSAEKRDQNILGQGLLLLFFPFRCLFRASRWTFRQWRKQPKESRQRFRRVFLKTAVTLGIFGFLTGIVAVILVSRDLPNPDRLQDRQIAQSTKIYDRTGTHLLYEIYADEKRTLIPFEKLPKDLVNGVIATEDKIFYEHHGVRPLSILRAAVVGLIHWDKPRGTSTLTQQLAKNAILSNERTFLRKAREIILALWIEQKYTKEQILQIYFNEIPYGSANYGGEAAAQSYFHKSATDLHLQEAATLAGLPKAPSTFLKDREALMNRRNFVLRRMYEEGYISEAEKEAAQAEPLTLEQDFNRVAITAPHFVMYVKDQLEASYGEKTVDTGGLKVITTLDLNKQELAEKAIREGAEKIFAEAEANNASLVAMDPRSGQILAMVGSRDFFDKSINGEFNVAVQGLGRQPGSSFKPIVYAAAFEKGYTPDTVLFDVETQFSTGLEPYAPKNYDLKEHGLVTMRKALQGSLNIPAVKTLYLVGEKNAIAFAERLGYTTLSKGDFGLSLVLGGGEVHLLEHVAAYGVLANQGIKMDTVSILRVEDAKGNTLEEHKTEPGDRVLTPDVAALISSVLNDDGARAYAFGSLGILTLKDRPVAAKTGTTNNYADAWTVGYTPSLAAGVWVGNSEGATKPMKRGFGGNKLAGTIWNQFMRETLEGTPIEEFPAPPPNDAEKPQLRGSVDGITLEIDRVTGKRATSSTPPDYIVRRTFVPPHDILHYINKDDPRGPAPAYPGADPQYALWESGVQSWIERSRAASSTWQISFDEPPTEFDDVHSFELLPELSVITPTPSSTLTSRIITAEVSVSAPRGVSRVIYRIDDRLAAMVAEPPFSLSFFAADLENGSHTLSVAAEDDLGNRRLEEIPFTLDAGAAEAYVTWTATDFSLSGEDFPRVFLLYPTKLDRIQRLTIWRERETGDEKIPVASLTDFSALFDSHLTFTWTDPPPPGRWRLTTEIETIDGTTVAGESATVVIE